MPEEIRKDYPLIGVLRPITPWYLLNPHPE